MKPGSTLKRVLRSIGIKPCGDCDKRAAWLDKKAATWLARNPK